MTKTDTKTAEALEQEFNFGDIDIGDQLEVDELSTITPVEEPKETTEESPEETEDSTEEEETEEESDEEEKDEKSEEEELTTEEVLGDPLKDKEEEKDEKGRTYEGYDDEDKQMPSRCPTPLTIISPRNFKNSRLKSPLPRRHRICCHTPKPTL